MKGCSQWSSLKEEWQSHVVSPHYKCNNVVVSSPNTLSWDACSLIPQETYSNALEMNTMHR
jgi:hypothetical protein